jgi:hypothetical protein
MGVSSSMFLQTIGQVIFVTLLDLHSTGSYILAGLLFLHSPRHSTVAAIILNNYTSISVTLDTKGIENVTPLQSCNNITKFKCQSC